MIHHIAHYCCLLEQPSCLSVPFRLPIGMTHAAYGCYLRCQQLKPPPQQPTKHHSHCPYLGWGSAAYHHCLTPTMLCCRGRITLQTRDGVEPDQLNFPLADYTDEEIPDSIEALQDAIKLDQVSAKLLSPFASVWLTASFRATMLLCKKAAQKMLRCSLCISLRQNPLFCST